MRMHVDENTGREVRQLTDWLTGATVPYFRLPRLLPDGRVLARGKHDRGTLLAVDPEGGDVEPLSSDFGTFLRLREVDGCAWFYHSETREAVPVLLPTGDVRTAARVPEDLPGGVSDITCDGRTVIAADCRAGEGDHGAPTTGDCRDFWRWIYRPRSATMWACDLETGGIVKLLDMEDYSPQHIDTSPTDPGLLKFAQDGLAVFDQRVFTVRTDGSGLRKIRPQEKGEWVHHEFWWPDGSLIGYKFMDRKEDPTVHELPWAEYAPRPLHLGIANLEGDEIYLSDPLTSYHSHLIVSRDGRLVCGEGTHNHSFACAGTFSLDESRVDLTPLATIHTPYTPSAAQGVETGFSADGRWLIYNDTIDDAKQVFAVAVDL